MVEDPFVFALVLEVVEAGLPAALTVLGQGVPGVVVAAMGFFGYVVL